MNCIVSMNNKLGSCTSTRMLCHPVVRFGYSARVKLLASVSLTSTRNRIAHFSGLAVHCFSSVLTDLRPRLRISATRPRPFQRHIISVACQHLNDEQEAAVQTEEDCVRVVAGPGSGKTLVLTHRVAYLIKKRGIEPSNMLCITFTNKAKEELRQRLRGLLGDDISAKLTIGTFHGVCVRMLRESARKEDIGVDKDFVIYDELDSAKVLRKILENYDSKELDPASKVEHARADSEGSGEQATVKRKRLLEAIRKYVKIIGQLKQFELRNFVAKQTQPFNLLEVPETLTYKQPIIRLYHRMLRSCNAVDFDDLIHLTVRMLYLRVDLLQRYRSRWSYVLADEFQDTDWAQYVLVRQLCLENKKLFVVGDVDQAIYGWRGADYRNMRDLERHFPGLATFELRRNYRSSPSILKLASTVISKSFHLDGSLKPLRLQAMKVGGPPVTIAQVGGAEEASYVLKRICALVDRKLASFGGFGILYRTRAQSQSFEKVFIANRIPYVISGSMSLLNYKEVKDLRAYLQFIWNQEDGVALDRVINTPPRGLGSKTLESIAKWASNSNISFPQALQKISEEEPSHRDLGISLRARSSLLKFCEFQKDLVRLSEGSSVNMLIQEVIRRTQFMEHLGHDEGSKERTNRVELFMDSAKSVEADHGCGRSALCMFLEAIVLNADIEQLVNVTVVSRIEQKFKDDKKLDVVKLSTLHAAKGLEFDYVYIVGVEEGNLPLKNADVEEERRLFYVGVTRARKELVITSRGNTYTFIPGAGYRQVEPSQFLQLPEELYQQEIITDEQ